MSAEKKPVTVIGLHAENFKKITVADVTPPLVGAVTVGGRNEQGKSSLLDAVAVALGGQRLAPKVPIKQGADEARVTVDLGDLKVTRTFRGDGSSTLVVTNADGSAKYSSPQSLLDKLMGGAPFYDPLRFSNLPPAQRRAEVATLLKLDFRELDAQRQAAVQARSAAHLKAIGLEDTITGVKPYEDTPAEEVDPAEALKAIEACEQARERVRQHEATVKQLEDVVNRAQRDHDEYVNTATSLRAQITKLQAELKSVEQAIDQQLPVITKAKATAQEGVNLLVKMRGGLPDDAPARQQIADAQVINARVRFNKDLARTERQIDELKAAEAKHDETVKAIDQQKADALAAAQWPVTGMGFADDDVVLDGLPFEQASTARRLRASVAMALAHAGDLRVLLVKQGNDLDDDNLRLLSEVAAEHGAQVWVERVANDPASVTVFLEEGAVKR